MIARRALLFALIFLTEIDVEALLSLRKFNLDYVLHFNSDSVNNKTEYYKYIISNLSYNSTDEGLQPTSQSNLKLIKISQALREELASYKDLIQEFKMSFIFNDEFYKQKKNDDFIFPL